MNKQNNTSKNNPKPAQFPRSPESFPKLRIFTNNWDLDHILNKQPKKQEQKQTE